MLGRVNAFTLTKAITKYLIIQFINFADKLMSNEHKEYRSKSTPVSDTAD